MILSDRTIKTLLEKKELVIEPMSPYQVGPASVDLRLSDTYLVPTLAKGRYFSMSKPVKYRSERRNSFLIPAHGFILASTMESIKLPNYLTSFVEGRSSIGRMGLFIQNAGWVDPGFEGNITLELYNANEYPMEIITGYRICQLVIASADGPVENPYRGKYYGQSGATGSKAYLDVEGKVLGPVTPS